MTTIIQESDIESVVNNNFTIENTFNSFLTNYFNNVFVESVDENYDIQIGGYNIIEEIIEDSNPLTKLQQQIVEYLSGVEEVEDEPIIEEIEKTAEELCDEQDLDYNPIQKKCCGPNQVFNSATKRCKKGGVNKKKKKVKIVSPKKKKQSPVVAGPSRRTPSPVVAGPSRPGPRTPSPVVDLPPPPESISFTPQDFVDIPPPESALLEETEEEKCKKKGLDYNTFRKKCCEPGKEFKGGKAKNCVKKK